MSKHRELLNLLSSVDNLNLGELGNPFLQISKPIQENLKEYEKLLGKSPSHLKNLVDIFVLLGTILFFLISNLLLSLFLGRFFQNKQQSQSNCSKSQILFFSHINADSTFSNDTVYGDILESLSLTKPFSVIYLNSTRKRPDTIYKSLNRPSNIETQILPKIPSLLDAIKVLKAVCGGGKKLSQLAVASRRDKDKTSLILSALKHQFDRKTYANNIIRIFADKKLKQKSFQYVCLTIEGHAHEALLINFLKMHFPKIRIIAVQHAAIVPDQSSYFKNLKLLRPQDKFFCTGLISSRHVKDLFQGSEGPSLHILGSSKCLIMSHEKPKKHFPECQVLFLPEGTLHNLAQMYQFAVTLSEFNPEKSFTVRKHPNTPHSGNLSKMYSTSTNVKNLKFSESSLRDDLFNHCIVIYRSSASAIQAAGNGIDLIHLNAEGAFNLDPIDVADFPHGQAYDLGSLVSKLHILFKSHNERGKSSDQLSQGVTYHKSYYQPVDISQLVDLIN